MRNLHNFFAARFRVVKGGLEKPDTLFRKNSDLSECLENVLKRKSYSTPVYLINIFEIGQVVLELGHFKDGVPKNQKSKKIENVMKKCSSRKSLQNHMGKSKNRNFGSQKISIFRLFSTFSTIRLQNFRFSKISSFSIFDQKFSKKVAWKFFSSKISRKIFHKIIWFFYVGDECLLLQLSTIL